MSTPAANLAVLNRARTAYFAVFYPDGFPVGGVRVPRSTRGLDLALGRMERHWMESFPGYHKEG